jgi:PDZ domain-containing secreted protein
MVLQAEHCTIYLWLYSPLLDLGHFFSFLIYTVCSTSWNGDQPVARPLATQRTTQTQNKRTQIHALSGTRTHDPIVQAGEENSCLRPLGRCDRPEHCTMKWIYPNIGLDESFIAGIIRPGKTIKSVRDSALSLQQNMLELCVCINLNGLGIKIM